MDLIYKKFLISTTRSKYVDDAVGKFMAAVHKRNNDIKKFYKIVTVVHKRKFRGHKRNIKEIWQIMMIKNKC